jgi:hypothetical protein
MDWREDELGVVAELEAMRPAPRDAFATELDARAAAGFRDAAAVSWRDRLGRRLGPAPWRRLAMPAAATAVAAIAVATAAISLSEGGRTETGERPERATSALAPDRGVEPAAPPPRSGAEAAGSVDGFPSAQYGGSTTAAGSPRAASGRSSASPSGPYAARAGQRDIARSARLVLAAEAGEVRAVAAEVFATVHAHDGIVLRSSVRDRGEGEASAGFDRLIPSGRRDDALAAFSAIAEVRSRSDSTLDVTAPTIGLEERLRDARARIEGLLAQLAAADTEAERLAAEAELRAERRRAAGLRSRLAALQRRTHLSRVFLRVESGVASAGDGRWGVGEAFEDAKRILGIAGGVSLIGLAILAPIGLIALVASLAHRGWRRRGRERALDGPT